MVSLIRCDKCNVEVKEKKKWSFYFCLEKGKYELEEASKDYCYNCAEKVLNLIKKCV